MTQAKSWLESKTVRTNGLVLLLCAAILAERFLGIDLGTGIEAETAGAGVFLTLTNIVLRFATNRPVE